jgi:hypothetical protein
MRNKSVLLALAAALILLAIGASACVVAPWDIPGQVFHPGLAFLGFPFALLGVAMYFLPTIIGAARRATGLVGIILLNIFAGWTGIGWVAALVWSLVAAPG